MGFGFYSSKVWEFNSGVQEYGIVVKPVVKTIGLREVVIVVKKPAVFVIEGICLVRYSKKLDPLIHYFFGRYFRSLLAIPSLLSNFMLVQYCFITMDCRIFRTIFIFRKPCLVLLDFLESRLYLMY